MKTTCLYENEEFGNTVRDILLDKKIQAETTRATEAENGLKESIATGIVTGLKISEDNVIQLIGLNDKIIAEAPLNIEIPTGIKTISLNGTALNLTYTDGSSKECDLASLRTEVKEEIDQAKETLQTHTENLHELSENVNDLLQADLENRIAALEEKIAELHPASGN